MRIMMFSGAAKNSMMKFLEFSKKLNNSRKRRESWTLSLLLLLWRTNQLLTWMSLPSLNDQEKNPNKINKAAIPQKTLTNDPRQTTISSRATWTEPQPMNKNTETLLIAQEIASQNKSQQIPASMITWNQGPHWEEISNWRFSKSKSKQFEFKMMLIIMKRKASITNR